MNSEIYSNLQPSEIVVLGYLDAFRSWGIPTNEIPSISSQVCGCSEITWDTFYDIIDTTDKVWGISYYQHQ